LTRGVIPAREVTTPLTASCAVTTMIKLLKRLLHEEDGPTAVEYGVMLAMIVVVCIGAVQSMATATADSFDTSAEEIAIALG
jgi:pilus assembly protein Flp/PilA